MVKKRERMPACAGIAAVLQGVLMATARLPQPSHRAALASAATEARGLLRSTRRGCQEMKCPGAIARCFLVCRKYSRKETS